MCRGLAVAVGGFGRGVCVGRGVDVKITTAVGGGATVARGTAVGVCRGTAVKGGLCVATVLTVAVGVRGVAVARTAVDVLLGGATGVSVSCTTVGMAVTVGRAVGTGLRGGCGGPYSYDPISHRPPTGNGLVRPRWSVVSIRP